MEGKTWDMRQFRLAIAHNNVGDVVLEADETGVAIAIQDKKGVPVTLIATNERTPRHYANPLGAIRLLSKLGFNEVKVIMTGKNKEEVTQAA